MSGLEALLAEIRACRHCPLPHPPRPVLRLGPDARLLIAGQAPGIRVHDSGIPWNDPSGDRLRAWLGLDRARFYGDTRIAILPAGLCFPGWTATGGDLPPRRECAPLWLPRLRPHLAGIQLTLAVGAHAMALHLPDRGRRGMTATVRAFRDYLPDRIPLPHPSWRNSGWLKRHPWFEIELLPVLLSRVAALLDPPVEDLPPPPPASALSADGDPSPTAG